MIFANMARPWCSSKTRPRKDIYQRIYIYIPYPIQKSGKRIFSYPFFEWDMLKDIYPYFRDSHIFISYPILYPFFSTNLNFAAFFSFAQCFCFCLRLLWGVLFWITHCTSSTGLLFLSRTVACGC
jgi:hypothetical protein